MRVSAVADITENRCEIVKKIHITDIQQLKSAISKIVNAGPTHDHQIYLSTLLLLF